MSARTTRRMLARDAPRVLVVYKKSAYQTNVKERKNARFIELIEKGDPSVARMVDAHRDHVETIDEARAALEKMGCRASFRFRGDEGLVEDIDLVVTVGGDGTLLWAARWVGAGIPVVAINSAPKDSVGHFCAGVKGSVQTTLEAAIAGQLREVKLTRMEVELEGEVLTRRVLNDALFAHSVPAATTRYVLRHERADGSATEEEHKSSGVWIGPAAGSTAAQLSAGGRVLPSGSKRLQYVVREPYVPPDGSYSMTRGLIDPGEQLVLFSKIREARIFMDGPHHVRDVRMGARVVMRRSEEPLSLLGFPRAERDG
ncbi:MAG: NAD(+)/NADH kinase [Myxococcota bacterium]|nr:NAD(+)/NADH kinase [Myxococcota bacterium]